MNIKLFALKKENITLARDEVLALTNVKKYKLIKNYLLIKTRKNLNHRLAQTKSIHEVMFIVSKNDLIAEVSKINWQRFYRGSFYVQGHNTTPVKVKQIAKLIGDRIKSPKVNVKSPKTKINFFFTDSKVICGINGVLLKHDFEKRKAHLRPEHHPSSMHPRLARTLVNLTGVQKVFLDPMCGAGGILIEAGLMGLDVRGFDNDPEMISRCKKNLKHYRIKGIIKQHDATKLKKKYSYIATDLPYGRSTKSVDRKKLYLEFLKTLKRIRVKRAVVVFPHYSKYDEYITKAKLKKKAEYSIYVHKTLTRKIVVLES